MWSVLTDFGLFNRLFRKKCPKMVFFLPKKSGFWSKGLFFTRDACDFFCKIVHCPLKRFFSCLLLSSPVLLESLGSNQKINKLSSLSLTIITFPYGGVDQCCPLMSYQWCCVKYQWVHSFQSSVNEAWFLRVFCAPRALCPLKVILLVCAPETGKKSAMMRFFVQF